MDVELSTVLSVAASVSTVVVGVFVGISRYALGVKEREIERQVGEARKAADEAKSATIAEQVARQAQVERFHEREQRVTKLEGELNLVKQQTGTLGENVHDIKETMVPRHEWEAHAARTDRSLDEILRELRNRSRYPSSSMPSTVPPRPTLKKIEE